MHTQQTLPDNFGESGEPPTPGERELARLAELARLNHELEGLRAGDRPVPLPMMRRAVFAAYRAAIAAGKRREAVQILRGRKPPIQAVP